MKIGSLPESSHGYGPRTRLAATRRKRNAKGATSSVASQEKLPSSTVVSPFTLP
jgi:hypothetical protein